MTTKFQKIINLLEEGCTVYFTTAYKITKVTKKHIPLFTTDKHDHIYIKGIDFTYCGIRVAK